ncbi:MAG: RNA polymerase sigma factor [Hominisplanchenecus sp.]
MKEKKFTEVFNRYNCLVRKLVISRTGDWMLAEEICQQVFLNYFEWMDKIEDELIQPWLLLTAKNLIRDNFRKQQVRRNTQSMEDMSDVAIVCDDNAERIIKHVADTMLTERILSELYERRKEWYDVIVDVCILEMSYEEAAKHLGVTMEVLRARLFRARKYIRKKYGKEYKET